MSLHGPLRVLALRGSAGSNQFDVWHPSPSRWVDRGTSRRQYSQAHYGVHRDGIKMDRIQTSLNLAEKNNKRGKLQIRKGKEPNTEIIDPSCTKKVIGKTRSAILHPPKRSTLHMSISFPYVRDCISTSGALQARHWGASWSLEYAQFISCRDREDLGAI